MYKKLFPLISLLLIAVFVLTACGPKATPAPEEPAGLTGTVTLWHAWKENEIASLNEVIAAFQALNPEVKFDVLYVPHDDMKGKFETATATGGGPTVLIGSADWGPGFYDASLVADLSGDLDQAFLGTINEAALGAVQYKGALIGLPQTVKGVLLFRNKSIVPEAATSLDDLLAKAKAADAGDVYGATLEYGLFFAAGHLHAVGGKLLEENGDPAFNNEKGVEWVNNILKFKYSDSALVFNNVDDDVNLFKAGKSGIIIDGLWNLTSFTEAIGAENLSVDPWPTGMSGYVQTENIYLNANAKDADRVAGVAFIKYFLTADAQKLLADATKAGHIPATKGVEVTDPLMKAAAVAFEGGTAFPVIPEMGAYWDAVNNALKKAMDEGVDPAVALQEAHDLVVAKVAEIRGQ